MKTLKLPERMPQYASEDERLIEAESPASAFAWTFGVTLLVGALIFGWLAWDVGLAGLAEIPLEDWTMVGLIFLITPLVIVGWNLVYRGAFRSIRLQETGMEIVARRSGQVQRIAWRRIVGLGRVRNRVGLGITLRLKDPKQKIKLGAPPFDSADLEEMYDALRDASQ